jgi:penicillin amidase
MNRGTENDLIVFGAKDAHSKVAAYDVAAPGESGFVAPDGTPSPQYADQVEMYATFGRKPMRLEATDVSGATKSVERLTLERP